MRVVDCALCGRPLPDHDRHIRFRLPDPVLATPEREQAAGVWLSHEDANNSVMMQVPEVGPFVRALLPVRLTGGYTVTFGVWIGVAPPDLQRAFQSWWSPDYPQLQLTGRLANTLPYWGLLAALVDVAVRDPEHTPYCITSPDPVLAAVLDREWPHEDILAATDRQQP